MSELYKLFEPDRTMFEISLKHLVNSAKSRKNPLMPHHLKVFLAYLIPMLQSCSKKEELIAGLSKHLGKDLTLVQFFEFLLARVAIDDYRKEVKHLIEFVYFSLCLPFTKKDIAKVLDPVIIDGALIIFAKLSFKNPFFSKNKTAQDEFIRKLQDLLETTLTQQGFLKQGDTVFNTNPHGFTVKALSHYAAPLGAFPDPLPELNLIIKDKEDKDVEVTPVSGSVMDFKLRFGTGSEAWDPSPHGYKCTFAV